MSFIQFKKYDREDVHDVLSPETRFTISAGTWGLQGIIKIPNTKADYVFFVTYGQSQGTHKFEECIDENGILSWQSQPKMHLQSKEIKDFISHNSDESNIYLFLRTSKKDLYTYLGNLEYVSHDNQRERPVFFIWRILNWNSEQALSALHDLLIKPAPRKYPIVASSFTWLSDNVLVKELDESVFTHKGTHIPLDVLPFWGAPLQDGEHRKISMKYHNMDYSMHLEIDNEGRTRLFWKTAFADVVRTIFPDAYNAYKKSSSVVGLPIMRFQKLDEGKYTIDLFDEAENDQSEDEVVEKPLLFADGRIRGTYSTRYERDPRNRALAIKHHGVTCYGCGFNFGAFYGPVGEGFIEIHHVNPLYQNDDEVMIDPRTDLIPLCSNCHRMVHRSKTLTMSIDELRDLIRRQRVL